MKKFDFTGSGGDGKVILDLASDPHLLLYLFCALLEHPQWMLHVDPFLHSSMQTGNNPLFLTMMPGVERFSEKHIAILSSAPTTLPAGACILAMGKQTPPVFALYWEKKLQFSLQVRVVLDVNCDAVIKTLVIKLQSIVLFENFCKWLFHSMD